MKRACFGCVLLNQLDFRSQTFSCLETQQTAISADASLNRVPRVNHQPGFLCNLLKVDHRVIGGNHYTIGI